MRERPQGMRDTRPARAAAEDAVTPADSSTAAISTASDAKTANTTATNLALGTALGETPNGETRAVVAAVDAVLEKAFAASRAGADSEATAARDTPEDAPGAAASAAAIAAAIAAAGAAEHDTDEAAARADRPALLRDALELGKRLAHERFEQGAAASTLLAIRTAVVDRVLERLWANEGAAFDGLTLLAVGGYGRGELHPGSDIDIAILVPSREDEHVAERLSAWLTRLWDLGIEIGHSVRTVAECETEAAADITVITNLIEARLLCGTADLKRAMDLAISPARIWSPAAFLDAKLAEQEARRTRYHDNAYRLEPNVKESLGGLRDFQTIAWVSRRQFDKPGLEPLVEHGLLDQEELLTLRDGLELIWRIRYLLHHLAGRREDRLLFDYQKEIAHAFGYLDDTDNRSIETLMQRYYRTVMSLQRLNEIVLQGLGGIISGVTAAAPVSAVGKRYQLRNGYLEVVNEDVFLHYPPALLEIFLVYSETDEAITLRSHTVRLIRKHLNLINDRFRSDPHIRSLFLSIFRSKRKLVRTVRMMNRDGVLAAYLPAFDAIVGRMQYDLFHLYTVDEHTILVIRNLRRFWLEKHAGELPHCHVIMRELARPSTLILSGLFHDIAKGRGGDHSELGAEDAAAFARSHGLDAHESALMEWTVRHHLLMSMTAQTKDIDDPSVQLEFARKVGTLERLDHLYLLSVADIRATNPELWNSFKQSLLQSLHRHARLILERGLDDPLGEETVIARRQTRTLALMNAPYVDDPRRDALWESLGDAYFRQYQANEIARHTEILLAAYDSPEPLVSLRHSASRGSTEILIYTLDDEALFALIATMMEALSLNVLSATISTTAAGFALDTFHVLETDNTLIDDPNRIEEIRSSLLQALCAPRDIPSLATRRPSRRLRHFDISTQVTFDDTEDPALTVLRITACDRPGILSSIGRLLLGAGVTVHAARIATLGERIDDVFYIGMPEGGPVVDPDVRKRLSTRLIEII